MRHRTEASSGDRGTRVLLISVVHERFGSGDGFSAQYWWALVRIETGAGLIVRRTTGLAGSDKFTSTWCPVYLEELNRPHCWNAFEHAIAGLER